MSTYFTDDVRGVIVDATEPRVRYVFLVQIAGIEHRFDSGWFLSDAEAEAWVKANYPAHYAQGIEMRVYDR